MSGDEPNFLDTDGDVSGPEYPDTTTYEDSDGELDDIARELRTIVDDSSEAGEEPDVGPSTFGPSTAAPHAGMISAPVSEILEQRWGTWKAVAGNKRKSVWRAVAKELRVLPEHQSLTPAEWVLRLKSYMNWMQKKGRAQKKRSTFFSAPKWTLRRVVAKYSKPRINEILETEFGVQLGSQEMVRNYQAAVSHAVNELSPAEKTRMEKMAEQFNKKEAPPGMKTLFAEHGVGKIMKQFAEEMWKRGGIRMVILTGWMDEHKGLFSNSFDFNPVIHDGPPFQGFDAVQGSWDQYIRQCFQPDGRELGEDDGEDSGPLAIDRKRPRKNRSRAAVQGVTHTDGTIWIPELQKLDRTELQDMVRGFLTAHYRQVCKNPKVSAPFKKLGQFQAQLFLEDHLPDDFTFPDDPSHGRKSEAKLFLEFIRDRQKLFPANVFAFQQWLDRNGDLRDPVETSEEDNEYTPAPRSKRGQQASTSRYMEVDDDEAEECPVQRPTETQPRQIQPSKATKAQYPSGHSDDQTEEAASDSESRRRRTKLGHTRASNTDEEDSDIDEQVTRQAAKGKQRDVRRTKTVSERVADKQTISMGEEARNISAKGKGKEVIGDGALQEVGIPAHLSTMRGSKPSAKANNRQSGSGPAAERRPRDGNSLNPTETAVKFAATGAVGADDSGARYQNKVPNMNSGRPADLKPLNKSMTIPRELENQDQSEHSEPSQPDVGLPMNVGPPIGVKRSTQSHPEARMPTAKAAPKAKIGPPVGVKRGGGSSKESALPIVNSGLRDVPESASPEDQGTSEVEDHYPEIPAVHTAAQSNPAARAPTTQRKQSAALPSAMKGLAERQSQKTQRGIRTTLMFILSAYANLNPAATPSAMPRVNSGPRNVRESAGTGKKGASEVEDQSHKAYQEVPVVYTAAALKPEARAPTTHRKQSLALKSAMKGSAPRPSQKAQENYRARGIGALNDVLSAYADLNPAATDFNGPNNEEEGGADPVPTSSKQSSRPLADLASDERPSASVQLDDVDDGQLATPRRSNRPRRTPARDDEDVPTRKRPAEGLPIIPAAKRAHQS